MLRFGKSGLIFIWAALLAMVCGCASRTSVWEAAQSGNTKNVKWDFNAHDSQGVTPLMKAAENDNPYVVSVLLDKGAQVNAADVEGRTALQHAAMAGSFESVKILVTHHARVNVHGAGGWTALHHAVGAKSPAIVEYLLENGADIEAEDINGNTPLGWAVDIGNAPLAEILVKHKADPNHRLKSDESLISRAAKSGNLAVIATLAKAGADVDEQSGPVGRQQREPRPLIMAISYGNSALVKCLLDSGASPNVLDRDDESPLMMALNSGKTGTSRMVQFLLEKGADVNWVNPEGRTALDYVRLVRNNPELAKMLIEKGAKSGQATSASPTPQPSPQPRPSAAN